MVRIGKVKTRFARHRQWLTTLRLRSSYTPISCVRLTYGRRNLLIESVIAIRDKWLTL
nr:MAG TPA: hypothetical protein [Caudoviricetes sp.]